MCRSLAAADAELSKETASKPTDITLTLSRRLIAGVRVKNILHIEAGLDMVALAIAISSKVSYI
jgi:hypothetical protein